MARGDLTVFEEFSKTLGTEKFDFDNDTIKLGIIDNSAAPTAADATPTWSDYSGNEVSTAGNYTADGETLANVSFNEVGGVATLDADNVTISQDGSGFTDGYYAIIYDSSTSANHAICFIDLGGPVSEQDGDVTITFASAGIVTVTVSNS
jgi:hypothetical protein